MTTGRIRIPETAVERGLYRVLRAIGRSPLGWLALMAGVYLAGMMVGWVASWLTDASDHIKRLQVGGCDVS